MHITVSRSKLLLLMMWTFSLFKESFYYSIGQPLPEGSSLVHFVLSSGTLLIPYLDYSILPNFSYFSLKIAKFLGNIVWKLAEMFNTLFPCLMGLQLPWSDNVQYCLTASSMPRIMPGTYRHNAVYCLDTLI